MIEYRFLLIRDAVITQVDEPKNFGSVRSVIKRAFSTHGSFYQFTDGDLKLGFTGDGRTVLKQAFEEDGKDADVRLTVSRRPDEYASFVTIFSGQANFLSYQLSQDYVEIDFENIDLQTKIKARFDQDYDTSKTTNLDGGTIAPDISEFNYNSLIIQKLSSYGMVPFAFTITQPGSIAVGTTTSFATDRLIDSGASFTTLQAIEVGSRVDNTTDTTEAFVTIVSGDTTLTIDENIMDTSEGYSIRPRYFVDNYQRSGEIYLDGRDEISFNDGTNTALISGELDQDAILGEVKMEPISDGSDKVYFIPFNNGFEFKKEPILRSYNIEINIKVRFDVTVGNAARYVLQQTIEDQRGNTIIVDQFFGDYVLAGDGIVEQDDTYTITITDADTKIQLGFSSQIGGDSTIQFYELTTAPEEFENDGVSIFLQAKWISEFPGTRVNGQLIHESIDKNLEYITGEENLLYSDFLGRTELGYSAEGCGGLFFETNGFNIRGTSRGIVGNLKDRLSSLNAIFNLGYGIQFKDYDKDEYQYRVEPSEYWYQPVEMASFTDIEQESYNETFFPELGFNEVQTGFSKYPNDNEEVASLLDWFGPSNYSLPSSKLSPTDEQGNTTKYEIVSDYIASPYLWETVRREQFLKEPTKGTKFDEDLFIVQLEDDYPNYRQLSRSSSVTITGGGELFDQPSEVRDSYFNFLIRPIYNLINHGFILNGALFGKNILATYRNIFYPNDQELEYSITASTCLGNDETYTNADDPLRGDMEDGLALFDPILINFKCALTRSQADEIILGHQNGLSENNYGYITVIDPDGNTKQGWVLELKFNPVDEIGEFQLIKRSSYGV